MRVQIVKHLTLSILTLSILVACGGGGSSGSVDKPDGGGSVVVAPGMPVLASLPVEVTLQSGRVSISLSWTMTSGQNGDSWELWVNGSKVNTVALIRGTGAQSGSATYVATNAGSYSFEIRLCHGNSCTRSAVASVVVKASTLSDLPPTITGAVATAVETGNALTGASTDDFLTAAINTLDYQRKSFDSVVTRLYNLNDDGSAKADGSSLTTISWNPQHDTALLGATFGVNAEVMVTNENENGEKITPMGIAVVGETKSQSRYLVMGNNPFRTNGLNNASTVNDQMDRFMINAIEWLSGKPSTGPLKIAIAQMDDSYWFKDESTTREWLTKKFGSNVSFNAADVYDASNLSKISSDGADLVILSQHYADGTDPVQIRNSIKALMDAGVPILYLQLDGGMNDLGNELFSLFQVRYLADNYWKSYLVNGLNGNELMGRLPEAYRVINEMLTHLKSGSYSFALAGADQSGTDANESYKAEFKNGADSVYDLFHNYDRNNVNIFSDVGREVDKLLALLGDKIRQEIHYPLTTSASSHRDFLRAAYADFSVYNSRTIVPSQIDLGTFSRSDFATVTPVTRTVSLISRPNFRSTGAYALPGKTVKVTRLDSNPVKTGIFVNTLRSGSTHMWQDNEYGGYARPKYLRSAEIAINPGQTIYLTSPYGGPIEASFDVKDVDVQFKIENVGEHAHWSGTQDDTRFAQKLADNQFDWVEVVTHGFEMHSKAERFKNDTLSNPDWNTPEKLGAATMKYTYSYTHSIAGFQGDGIVKEAGIYGWAQNKGITVQTTNTVKHMNADVPTCGWGCSGNPYDAGWAFSPIGHGDLHELGHSLQSSRWQLRHGSNDYPNHAGTNFYAFYPQSRYFDDTGHHDDGQHGMPFKELFLKLQEAYTAGDRVGSVSASLESYFAQAIADKGDGSINNSYSFYLQFMMQARQKNLLENGFHMMGRIHIIERAFREAIKDENTWNAEKGKLGFSLVNFNDAKNLSNNDFMAIAMSYTSGLDCRDYMAMWGFRVSTIAAAQVAAFNLPVAERVFFALDSKQWVEGALSNRVNSFAKLPIDGSTAWPLN